MLDSIRSTSRAYVVRHGNRPFGGRRQLKFGHGSLWRLFNRSRRRRCRHLAWRWDDSRQSRIVDGWKIKNRIIRRLPRRRSTQDLGRPGRKRCSHSRSCLLSPRINVGIRKTWDSLSGGKYVARLVVFRRESHRGRNKWCGRQLGWRRDGVFSWGDLSSRWLLRSNDRRLHGGQ